MSMFLNRKVANKTFLHFQKKWGKHWPKKEMAFVAIFNDDANLIKMVKIAEGRRYDVGYCYHDLMRVQKDNKAYMSHNRWIVLVHNHVPKDSLVFSAADIYTFFDIFYSWQRLSNALFDDVLITKDGGLSLHQYLLETQIGRKNEDFRACLKLNRMPEEERAFIFWNYGSWENVKRFCLNKPKKKVENKK